MPPLSRWMVKLALLNLGLGFTLGGLLLANKGIPLHPTLWLLLPAHQEFLITGWMFNLTMGVAYLDPAALCPGSQTRQYSAGLDWLDTVKFGIWAIAISPFATGWDWMPLFGRLLQASGGVAFALHAWPWLSRLGLDALWLCLTSFLESL